MQLTVFFRQHPDGHVFFELRLNGDEVSMFDANSLLLDCKISSAPALFLAKKTKIEFNDGVEIYVEFGKALSTVNYQTAQEWLGELYRRVEVVKSLKKNVKYPIIDSYSMTI